MIKKLWLIFLLVILVLQIFNLYENNSIREIKSLDPNIVYFNSDVCSNGTKSLVAPDSSKIYRSRKSTINVRNYDEKRRELILDIFGSTVLPTTRASIVGVEYFEKSLFYRLSTGARYFRNDSKYLLIFHAGHKQDSINDDAGGHLLRYALNKKYDVLLINMPLGEHSRFCSYKYPIAEFISPVLNSLNFILSENKYEFVTMAGLSGGGWTTVVYSAIDERINKSVSVAGSWPLYLRYKSGDINSIGDYEQTLPGIRLGYLDLYALGTTNSRRQLQIFNSNDPCCFSGDLSLGYHDTVSKISTSLGGKFEVAILDSNKHEVDKSQFNSILLTY